MADVNANIGVNIDTSEALAQLKSLQRQISQFHTSIAKSSETAAIAQQSLAKNLINSINSIGAFSAELRTVKTTSESFTDSLEKNKFSMREYFRYAGGATKTFGKLFRSEFDTISNVAEERVKRLQTQYIKLGRDSSGAMKSIAIMPTSLNMEDYNTKLQIAAQRQQLFNQLMRQGSTNLINFGKNTQWAGRQLMVGFTIPLSILGNTASRAFMEMETQAIKFKKVYGDLFTPGEETQKALEDVQALASMFTKYGVAASQTVGLAAEAAAAGFSGIDLQRQTAEATRLSVLGQIDSQKALETTISLQSAFKTSSADLADQINFLNAVENQTVVSLDDITTAIPKVAPVIQQLGGNVKDLAFFLAAMKEGGVNASEGANALKSGLAALINPTEKASAMLGSMGINIKKIIETNKGDLRNTVLDFAKALDTLDPLTRARAIEQLFGKFQFARLSTLFSNVTQSGNQASRVLQLAGSSIEELAALSEQELELTAGSSMNKFKKAVEDLRLALVPVGETFLKAITPIVDFIGNILEKFNNLSDGAKKVITILTVGLGAVGPVLLMTFGLLANGIGNLIKLFLTLRGGYQRLTGQTNVLGQQTQYMTSEQLDAAAAAHSLDQAHAKLTQQFLAETTAVMQLRNAYLSAIKAGQNFALNNPGSMLPPRPKKLASGIVSVPGPKGAGDVVPAMLSPGEAVIPTAMAKKYAPLIQGMIADNIPGYEQGRAKRFFNQSKIDQILRDTGVADDQRLRIPLPISSPSYSVSGVMAPKSVNTTSIGMTKEYLSSPMGRASLEASIQAELEGLGVSAERVSEVLNSIAPQLNTAVDEFDDTIEGWKNASTKAIRQIEDSSKLTPAEKSAIRKRVAPINPQDYTVISDPVLEIKKGSDGKKGKGTPRSERKDSAYKAERQKQILKQRGYTTDDLVFAHMPGYEKIQGTQRATMRPPSAGGKILTGAQLAAAEKLRKDYLINQGISEQEIEKIAREDAEIYQKAINKAAGVASPSKKTRKTGEDIARGLEVGMQSREDDVAKVGASLGSTATKSVKGGVTNVPFRAPGQPGFVAGNAPASSMPGVSLSEITAKARFNRDQLLATQQAKRMQAMNRRMDSLNRAFLGATFAVSALSGVASTAGGNLGKFSEILFQISGPLFALSSVIQLLTGQKIIGLITKFKVGFGLLSAGLIAGVVAIKLYNNARKKELEYIYGLSNAMKTTTDQVKTLGDFFGFVPTKLPFEGRNREIVTKDVRTTRDRLREDAGFQEQFGPQIQTLSKATAQEAQLAFTSLALNLKAQGFAPEMVQTIIDALREEAGKLDVKLDVKSLNFSPESISSLQTQIRSLLGNLGTAIIGGGIKQVTKQSRATGEMVTYTETTNDAKKALEELGTFISETSKSSAGMFRLGIIDGKQFESSLSGILETMNGLDESTRKVALLEIFKKLDINAGPFIKNLKTAQQEMMVLALLSSGALSKSVIEDLSATGSDAQFRRSRAIYGLTKAYEGLFGAVKQVNDEDKKGGGGTGNGGTGEKTWLQKLEEQITATKTQTEAFYKMRNAGVEASLALELASNPEFAKGITEAANGTAEAWGKAVKAIKDYQAVKEALELAQIAGMNRGDYELQRLNKAQAYIDLQSHFIKMEYAAQLESIAKSQEENDLLLQRISYQETLINNRYNPIIDRLQKIESLNKSISEIESRRLDVVSALSSGDVSGGIKALQELRATRAAQTSQSQIDNLNAAKERELSLLTQNNLTRDQIDLQNQKLSLDRREIELAISKKETALTYFGMTKMQLDNAARSLDLAKSAGVDITSSTFLTNILDAAIGKTNSLRLAADEAAKSFAAMLGKQETARTTNIPSLATSPAIPQLFRTPVNGTVITTPWDIGIGRSMGGIVPKYFANGGLSRGTDTIPAMLTPGEYVVRKSAVDALGIGAMNNINNGKASSNSVYNYSLSVNVDGTSANANDIARVVMSEIKKVDQQRIRGIR